MVQKREGGFFETQSEFALTHSDVRDMMNDTNVLLEGGSVPSTQGFRIILRKGNGEEVDVLLRDMVDGDTIVFRFSKIFDTRGDVVYTDVDVS